MGYDFDRSTRGPARLFGLLGLPDHNFSGRAGSGGCPTGPWVSPPSGKFIKVLQVLKVGMDYSLIHAYFEYESNGVV